MHCPVAAAESVSGGVGGVGGVHINEISSIDDSWLPCDDVSQRRYRLALTGQQLPYSAIAHNSNSSTTQTGQPSSIAMWVLKSSSRCFFVRNYLAQPTILPPSSLSSGATSNDADLSALTCAEVKIDAMQCAIPHKDCQADKSDSMSQATQSAQAAAAAAAATNIRELTLVSVYFKLQGPQRDDNLLAPFQLSELEAAFASIFKLPRSHAEIIPAYPAAFPLSYITANSPLQLHMRMDPQTHLPAEIKAQIPNGALLDIKHSSATAVTAQTSPTSSLLSAVSAATGLNIDIMKEGSLVRSVMKEYILAVVQHESFAEVLAATMVRLRGSSQSTTSTRHEWFVPSSAYFAGVTVRAGAVPTASTTGSTATRSDVECEHTPAVVWADYFGLTGSLGDSGALLSEDGFIMGTVVPFLTEYVLPLFGEPYSMWWFFSVGVAFGLSMYCALTSALIVSSLFFSMCPACAPCPNQLSNRVPQGFEGLVRRTRAD